MNDFSFLKLKCAALQFADLESLEKMANEAYIKMIAKAANDIDRNGFINEKAEFSAAIEKIKAERVFNFINNE